MARRPRRAVIIGLDAAIPGLTRKWMAQGELPHLKALAERGVSLDLLPPFPTLTPANWSCIATGAWPGTLGISGYQVHHPGDPLDRVYSGFNSRECRAEFLWNAAARAGRRSILLKYPVSWPPTIGPEQGVVVDGCGPTAADEVHELFTERLFTTLEGYPLATPITLGPPSHEGSGELPEGALEGLAVFSKADPAQGQPNFTPEDLAGCPKVYDLKDYFLRVLLIPRRGRPEAVIAEAKADQRVLATLTEGQWSEWITAEFEGKDGGTYQGAYRLRLLELSPDCRGVRLFSTQVFPREGFTSPLEVGPLLFEHVGPFLQRPGWECMNRGWIDDETFLELIEYQNDYFGRAAEYLLSHYPWDLFCMQTHTLDYAGHSYMAFDPVTARVISGAQIYYPGLGVSFERHPTTADERRHYEACLRRAYRSVDQLIGHVVSRLDEETLVIVVSDHGQKAGIQGVNVARILEDTGLMVHTQDPRSGRVVVDWAQTRATPQRVGYVYVNLRGRDPYGIVEPSDYDDICEEIVEALRGHRDEATGLRPFALVLRRDEARILGLAGKRAGDVVYALRPEFGKEHGEFLPSSRFGEGGQECLFVMAGPGVRRGARLTSIRWLTDVAPTIAYLCGFPMPAHAEGGVMYDALEDPDLLMTELEALRRENEHWRQSARQIASIQHSEP